MDANLLRHIYDWKIERMSNTGELNFTDDDEDTFDYGDSFQSADHRYPGKRRLTRHNLVRSRINGGSVMEIRKTPRHETLRRTSSADTDKHIANTDDECSLSQSKCLSSSEFSLNNQPKRTRHDDLDNVVEFIQKLTSSRSMTSDKKLQYVSELLLNLDINDTTQIVTQKSSRRRYSPSAKIIRKISRKSSATDKKPSEEIYDLNRRLCRSLDNILDIDLDSREQSQVQDDKTKSMLHIPQSRKMCNPLIENDSYNKVLYETNEISSRESLDSSDDGSSRLISQSDDALNNKISPSPGTTDANTHSEILNPSANNTTSFVIYHKHSRERSIDCTPRKDVSPDKSTDEQSLEDSKDNFHRKSVTRIASIYKKRKSWNVNTKPSSKGDEEDEDNVKDSELTSPDQVNNKSVPSDIKRYQRFPELDFSCGIFGSAPRKSMLSVSTDLGYDSQQDHAQSDDVITKETVARTVSGGQPKGRRHSITCGTSALRLRRTSSNELDSQNKSHISHSREPFKEYKV